MFKAELKAKLSRIFEFDLQKTTFDKPGESQEQEAVFIDVISSMNKISPPTESAKVTGRLHIFANADKLPYGYFSKKIKEADSADTKDLFFFEFEENKGTFRNICERSLSFIYFFEKQYDPEQGEITSINTTLSES